MSRGKDAYEAMAWSQDPLVRDIYSEIDDRDLYEIAASINDVYFGADWEWEEVEEDVELMRSFEEPVATRNLTQDEASDALILASSIVDWANYGVSYGDYSNPPWEEYE